MRVRLLASSLTFLLIFTSPAHAAPPVLEAVPADAWVVVTFRDLAGLDAKLARLINPLMSIPVRPLLLVKGQLGMVEGIDEGGAAAIAVLPGGGGRVEESGGDARPTDPTEGGDARPTNPTEVVMWVPTTDRTKLLAFISPEPVEAGIEKVELRGEESFAGTRGRFTVLGGALPVVRRVVREGPGVARRFTTHQLERFEKNDVSVYVNLSAIRTSPLFGSLSAGLSLLGIPPGDVERYRGVQLSLRFEEAGVAVEIHTQTEEAEAHPAPQASESLLASLPAEPFVFALGMNLGGSAEDRAAPARLVLDSLERRGVLDPARKGDVERVVEKVYGGAIAAAVSVSALEAGPDGLVGMTKVVRTESPASALTAGLHELLTVLKGGVFLDPQATAVMERVTYARGAETIGGASVDHLTLDVSGLKEVDEAAMIKAVGKEGLLVRIAAVDDRQLLVTFGGGATRFAAALQAMKPGGADLTSDPLIARSDVANRPHHVEAYLAIDRAMELAGGLARAMDEPVVVPKMPPLDQPVSMIARRINPKETQVEMFVPMPVIVAVKEAAMSFTASKISPPTGS